MNEFENKLRGLPFREPPADLRQSVLVAAEPSAGGAQPWTWRDWLWPAPLAWAALMILLAGAFAADAIMGHSPEGEFVSKSAAEAPDSTLLAFQPRGQQMAFLQTLH